MLIGEVAARCGVSARMLRHYESLGLIAPKVVANGFRDFSEDDIAQIFYVEGLRSLGLSLKQVQEAMHDPAFDPPSVMRQLITETTERIAAEKELLQRLKAVHAARATDWESALEAVAILNRLHSSDPAVRQAMAFGAASGRAAIADSTLAESALLEQHINAEGALSWAVVQQGEHAVAKAARGMASRDPDVRLRAIKIVAQAPEFAAGEEILLEALTDQSPLVRAEAALSLGKNHHEQAVSELMSMVMAGIRDVEAGDILAGYAPHIQAEVLGKFEMELHTLKPLDPQRNRITQVLAEFLPDSAPALAILHSLRDDPNPAVSFTAKAIMNTHNVK